VRDLALLTLVALWAIVALCALVVFALLDSLATTLLPERLRERYWRPYPHHPEKCPVCGGRLIVQLKDPFHG
jgi:hypothetical protein